MLTRDYKLCGPGEYYHIYNRGNAKDIVFRDDEDYKFFLLRLRQNIKPDGREGRHFKPLPTNSFSLVAYCLMPNHFHLLLRQNLEIPTSKVLGKICTSYSMYFNRKYGRVGHVFQDQFKQKNVDDNKYLLGLSTYIHLNPVRAGLVMDATGYRWSSVHEYIDNKLDPHLVESDVVTGQIKPQEYISFLKEAIDKENLVAPHLLF